MSRTTKTLPTSPRRRLLRLGGLVGRVGASVAAGRALGLVRSRSVRDEKARENLVRNALRVVETLGEMKGAAMKVGQMLSLHEGLMPPEVSAVLRRLQREAPRVPAEVMRYEVEGSLGRPIGELFADFEEEGFAAASIGQVHAARLHDGRRVAVKVQYPLIREIVTADLENLRGLVKSLLALVFEADFEPLWAELRDRLLEELDYEHEAGNMRELRVLHADVPEVVIPAVVDELSTDRVLTMERVDGISPTEAAGDRYPQELKDRWGVALFEFQMRGLFEHRALHADPNFSNFAFTREGKVIVYDFGSVKRVPEALTDAYAGLLMAVLAERREEVPSILADMGLSYTDGSPVPLEIIDPYLDVLAEILREEPPYRFGEDPDLYREIFRLGLANLSEVTDLRFPRDVIFIDRSLGGHFGNLIRLGASGPWRQVVERYCGRRAGRKRRRRPR